jgi:hypothetical protein
MPAIASSSFRGIIGVARRDITPPIGIHMRNWAAATHEVADGVHRPLTLTTLTFERLSDRRVGMPLVLMSADLMSWRSREAEGAVIGKILTELGPLPRENLMFCLSHNHAAPSIRPEDEHLPGGNLIAPYREKLVAETLQSVRFAQVDKRPATLTWHYGTCDLATNRDWRDPQTGRWLCGFNPNAAANDTLLVGRITGDGDDGNIIATIVNYACHPTTLAWQNRLLSPDYVGAMRELVESATNGAPCLFLQGASGELAPAEQYTGDVAVADRHGRRLGHAVLATLDAMPSPGTALAYGGVVESGAPLAVWSEQPAAPSETMTASVVDVNLPLKPAASTAELQQQLRDCRDAVEQERLRRKLAVRERVGDGPTTPMGLWTWRLGDALLIGQPNEAYSDLQTELRRRLRFRPVAVMNLVNGSAGYLPPRELYDHDIYQVRQSPFAAGALELLIESAAPSVEEVPR